MIDLGLIDWGLFAVMIIPFIVIKMVAFIYLVYRYCKHKRKKG